MRGVECGRCTWVYASPINSWGKCPKCGANMSVWGNGDELPDFNDDVPIGQYVKDPLLMKAEEAIE